VIIERASVDEVYLDVSVEAGRRLQDELSSSLGSNNNVDALDAFIRKATNELREVPTLIAGDDIQEMRMNKNEIRDGHSGTVFSKKTLSSSSDGTGVLVEGSAVKVTDFKDNDNDSDEDYYELDNDELGDDEDTSFSLSLELTQRALSQSQSKDSWFSRPLELWTRDDLLLLAGALVVLQLRRDVFNTLGYTCSAGIAHNKMLAKLSSGMHKPNKQTLVPTSAVATLLNDLPFSRVQGFGGKLGTEITNCFGEKIRTLGDLLALPKSDLTRVFGVETTQWITMRARGIDNDKVQQRALPISIGCSKSFRGAHTLWNESLAPSSSAASSSSSSLCDGAALRWLTELSKELTDRVVVDMKDNDRIAKLLSVGCSLVVPAVLADNVQLDPSRPTNSRNSSISLSKVTRFSFSPSMSATVVAQTALSILQRAINDDVRLILQPRWGILSLSLGASHFEQVATGKKSITSFFSTTSEHEPDQLKLASAIPTSPVKPKSASEGTSDEGATQNVVQNDVVCIDIVSDDQQSDEDSDVKTATVAALPVDIDQSSKRAVTGNNRFQKYLKDIDPETFQQLPLEIQQELMNEAMFRSATSTTKTVAGKKRKGTNNSEDTAKISKWFSKTH
jgi:nucleotidyltransferase/DNA polymerase involved in DNA repair